MHSLVDQLSIGTVLMCEVGKGLLNAFLSSITSATGPLLFGPEHVDWFHVGRWSLAAFVTGNEAGDCKPFIKGFVMQVGAVPQCMQLWNACVRGARELGVCVPSAEGLAPSIDVSRHCVVRCHVHLLLYTHASACIRLLLPMSRPVLDTSPGP